MHSCWAWKNRARCEKVYPGSSYRTSPLNIAVPKHEKAEWGEGTHPTSERAGPRGGQRTEYVGIEEEEID